MSQSAVQIEPLYSKNGLLDLLFVSIEYELKCRNKVSRLSDPCEKHRRQHKRCPINCKDRKIVPKDWGISK